MTAPGQERRELTARFKQALTVASGERDDRQFTVVAPDGRPEMGWVAYERHVMRQEVDAARAERSKPPVTRDWILWAERQSVGHSDYALQWALRCTELVLDRD